MFYPGVGKDGLGYGFEGEVFVVHFGGGFDAFVGILFGPSGIWQAIVGI
jgi:hypothetical protein